MWEGGAATLSPPGLAGTFWSVGEARMLRILRVNATVLTERQVPWTSLCGLR